MRQLNLYRRCQPRLEHREIGLNPGDEILAINGRKMSAMKFLNMLQIRKPLISFTNRRNFNHPSD